MGLGSASAVSCTHHVLVWYPGCHGWGQLAACSRDPGSLQLPGQQPPCIWVGTGQPHRTPRQLSAPATRGPESPGAVSAMPPCKAGREQHQAGVSDTPHSPGCQTRGTGGTLAARATSPASSRCFAIPPGCGKSAKEGQGFREAGKEQDRPHPAAGKQCLPGPETIPWPRSLLPSPSRSR